MFMGYSVARTPYRASSAVAAFATEDVAPHTPRHCEAVSHWWHSWLAVVSIDRLGDIVGAFVGINDRRAVIFFPASRSL